MHGGGLASDSAGSLYFSTGNGAFDGASNFGDSFLRLKTTPTLAMGDYFAPYNQQNLDNADLDVSSGAVTLLPDSAGTTQHPHIMIGCGKNGALYVLDRDNLGQFSSSGDTQIIQELLNVVGGITGVDPLGNSYIENCYSSAAYWQGRVYFGGIQDNLKMFTFSNGLLSTSAVSQSSEVYGFPGASPSITANGATQGIVWAIESAGSGNAVLHAYDATNLTNELYNSSQNASDAAGAAVKFATPTVANGKAYVGTQNSLAVYGLFSSLPQAAAPSFSQPGGTYSGSVSVIDRRVDAGNHGLLHDRRQHPHNVNRTSTPGTGNQQYGNLERDGSRWGLSHQSDHHRDVRGYRQWRVQYRIHTRKLRHPAKCSEQRERDLPEPSGGGRPQPRSGRLE